MFDLSFSNPKLVFLTQGRIPTKQSHNLCRTTNGDPSLRQEDKNESKNKT
jgi:hypothetical protein